MAGTPKSGRQLTNAASPALTNVVATWSATPGVEATKTSLYDMQKTMGVAPLIANPTAVRALTSAFKATAIYMVGYYSATTSSAPDIGGGLFILDSSDTTTADNGGTVFVDLAGRRWKRVIDTMFIRAEWFGVNPALSNNVTVITAADVYAASVGLPLQFSSGTFQVSALTATTSWYGVGDSTLFKYNTTTYGRIITATGKSNLNFELFKLDGNCSTDPVSWNSGNYDSFTGGSGLWAISCTNTNIVGVNTQNTVRAGINAASCSQTRIKSCTTTRTRGNFGDGIACFSMIDLIIDSCRAFDYTRIGFVVDTFGDSPLTSYDIKITNCHSQNGHNASKYYGGFESNCAIWIENIGTAIVTGCTGRLPGSRGVVVASGVKNNGYTGDTAKIDVANCQMFDLIVSETLESVGYISESLAGTPTVTTFTNCVASKTTIGFSFAALYDGDSVTCNSCHVDAWFNAGSTVMIPYLFYPPDTATFTKRPSFSVNNSTITYMNEIAGYMEGYNPGGGGTSACDVGSFTGYTNRLGLDVSVHNVRNTDESKFIWLGTPYRQVTNWTISDTKLSAARNQDLGAAKVKISDCTLAQFTMGNAALGEMLVNGSHFIGHTVLGADKLRINSSDVDMTGSDYLWLFGWNATTNKPVIQLNSVNFSKDINTDGKVLRLNFSTHVDKVLFNGCNFYNSGSASATNPFIEYSSGTRRAFIGCLKDDTVTNLMGLDSGGGFVTTPTGVTAETMH